MVNLPSLPEELVEEILERLPTKKIAECKLLSKWWFQRISEKGFIRRHLKNMCLQNRFSTLIHREYCFVPLQYFFTSNGQRRDRREVYYGLGNEEYVACCESYVLAATMNDKIYLLNPSTRRRFTLPSDPIKFPPRTNSTSVLFGVGYNPRMKDYQVVRLSLFHSLESMIEVKLYSKATNQWKNIGEFAHPRLFAHPGVYANYCVHWLLYSKHIVAFDLVDESYRLIDLPNEVNHDHLHHSFTALNRDTIVMMPTFYLADEDIEMWILTDYADDKFWVRHTVNLVVPISVIAVITFQPLYFIEPSREKVIILVNPLGTFRSWDLKTQRFQPYAGEQIIRGSGNAYPVIEGLW